MTVPCTAHAAVSGYIPPLERDRYIAAFDQSSAVCTDFHNGCLQVSQLQCSAPIYATHPVSKMGQMLLHDQCLNSAAVSEFDAFDLNDIDLAFAHVTTLKYQQVFSLTGQPLHAPAACPILYRICASHL